jgi:hypothetical protein
VRDVLGLCYVGIILVVFWIYIEILGYLELILRLLAFWSHVAFTVELHWTFFEVIVELLSSYLRLT